jgi:MFS family permease
MTIATGVLTRQATMDAVARRGRWAIVAVFFLNGLTITSNIVRTPTFKANLHLTDAQLGVAATIFGASALVAMQLVGALVARFGSRRVIRLALLGMPLALVGVSFTRNFLGYALVAAVFGLLHGTVDVSMNAHAVAVERQLRRPVMSGCHAAWSVSAVAGSLLAAALIRAGAGLFTHFLAIGVVVVVGSLVAGRFLLPASADRRQPVAPGDQPDDRAGDQQDDQPRPAERAGWRAGWGRTAIWLGVVGAAIMLCEAGVLTWSGVFLHENRGASLALASIAVTAYTACQTAGRLVGDRLTARIGAGRLFRSGGLVAAAGFAVAVLSPTPAGAIAGFAILGVGTSPLLPLVFGAAGHAGGTGPGAARFVSRVTTLTYAGILLGPAVIGWIADRTGLQWTLLLLVPLLCIVAMLARLPARTD